MPSTEVLDVIREHREEMGTRFDVESLSVFGSAARGTLHEDSDVDILVTFDGPATFDRYMELKFFLEDKLGRSVDLVTEKALRPEMASTVAREGVHVA